MSTYELKFFPAPFWNLLRKRDTNCHPHPPQKKDNIPVYTQLVLTCGNSAFFHKICTDSNKGYWSQNSSSRFVVFGNKVCLLIGRSQWPRGLRRRSAAARLLRSWVRIPPGAWKFVCFECCVLSGRGLCDGLITRPEESYRLWCVVVWDPETSRMSWPWPTGGCCATGGGEIAYWAVWTQFIGPY